MKKKIGFYIVLFLSLFSLIACKQTDKKTENGKKAVQVLKNYYKEQHKQSEDVSNSLINFYVWENNNNYYVLAVSVGGYDKVVVDVEKKEFVDIPLTEKSIEQVIFEKYKEQKVLPDYQEVNTTDIRASLKSYMRENE